MISSVIIAQTSYTTINESCALPHSGPPLRLGPHRQPDLNQLQSVRLRGLPHPHRRGLQRGQLPLIFLRLRIRRQLPPNFQLPVQQFLFRLPNNLHPTRINPHLPLQLNLRRTTAHQRLKCPLQHSGGKHQPGFHLRLVRVRWQWTERRSHCGYCDRVCGWSFIDWGCYLVLLREEEIVRHLRRQIVINVHPIFVFYPVIDYDPQNLLYRSTNRPPKQPHPSTHFYP